MNSTNSNEAHGTTGAIQGTFMNLRYENFVMKFEVRTGLSRAQKAAIDTINATITDHLTEMDYSGVERDFRGNPVPKPGGGFYNHIHEMRDAYIALSKKIRSIDKSLTNPNLEDDVRNQLSDARNRAIYHKNKIENLFNSYGATL